MKIRKFELVVAGALALGLVSGCGSSEPEPEESPVEIVDEDPVELDPEKMTGELTYEQSGIFAEYALNKVQTSVCDSIYVDTMKDDARGVVNLALDAVGRDLGVESISASGVLHYWQTECD